MKPSSFFRMDERLGLPVPALQKEWEEYAKEEQDAILCRWEQIRGSIPDLIKAREAIINEKQASLEQEDDFIKSCELNAQIADNASIINDLWLLYRTHQDISSKIHM